MKTQHDQRIFWSFLQWRRLILVSHTKIFKQFLFPVLTLLSECIIPSYLLRLMDVLDILLCTNPYIDMTWSSRRPPPQYNSIVHSKTNFYFLGIGPICYVDLTCIFRPVSPPLYVVSKIGLINNVLIHISFQIFLSWHCIIFCDLFLCRIRKNYILKLYIYFPYINTQRRPTAQFDDTTGISPPHSKN